MKKIILFLICFTGLLPVIENGNLRMAGVLESYAGFADENDGCPVGTWMNDCGECWSEFGICVTREACEINPDDCECETYAWLNPEECNPIVDPCDDDPFSCDCDEYAELFPEECDPNYDKCIEEPDCDCEDYALENPQECNVDCADVEGGTADYDDCGTCVGGTTGKTVQTWYEDKDNDSWGDSNITKNCHDPGSGWVLRGGDHNDNCYNVANDMTQCDINKYCDDLTNEMKNELNGALLDLKTDYETALSCARNFLYNYFKNQNKIIEFCLIASGNGGYNPLTKGIDFNGIYSMIPSVLAHEIFHAYQDNCSSCYPGGIGQYLTDGFPNIEFEAVLYEDILNGSFNSATAFAGGNSQDQQDYVNFLTSITNNNTVKPTSFTPSQMQEYYRLVEQYNLHRGYGKITNTSLSPNAMFNMFNNLDCN